GVAHPTSNSLNTYATGNQSTDNINKLQRDNYDLSPYPITTMLAQLLAFAVQPWIRTARNSCICPTGMPPNKLDDQLR
ncbi:hypothetical protein RA268_30300, partial [Pseudomonas syringae pv. tagetis]